MPEPRTVVGGTIGALVAADALGRAGTPVRLLAPVKGIGRGFSPLPCDGRRLQLGVRLMELSYEGATDAPPLSAYEPGADGHRPFAPLLRAWAEELVGEQLRPIRRPQVLVGDRLVDDYLFTVDLAPLAAAADPALAATIAAEARAAVAAEGPAGALGAPLGGLDLATASLRSHGPAFHAQYIEPVADKLLAGGSGAVLAEWRRKAWLPLFWPQTVAEAFSGGQPAFAPARTFEQVGDGGVSGLVEALWERIGTCSAIEVVDVGPLERIAADGPAVVLDFAGGRRERAERPALAVPSAELHAAAGTRAEVGRMRTVVAWVEAAEAALAPGVDLLHVVSPSNPVVRVSSGSTTPEPGRRVVCVELRHDVPDDEIGPTALAGLRAAGLLDDSEAVVLRDGAISTLPLPDAATRKALATAGEAFAALGLDALLLGSALAPGADTMNEQITQGLLTGEALR